MPSALSPRLMPSIVHRPMLCRSGAGATAAAGVSQLAGAGGSCRCWGCRSAGVAARGAEPAARPGGLGEKVQPVGLNASSEAKPPCAESCALRWSIRICTCTSPQFATFTTLRRQANSRGLSNLPSVVSRSMPCFIAAMVTHTYKTTTEDRRRTARTEEVHAWVW